MWAIVAEAYAAGPDAVAELLPLLEEPPSNQWLAFQVLELGNSEPGVAEQCLAVIRRMAAGSGAEATGAGIWLREWSARKA